MHQINGSSFEELSGSDILRLLPTYPTERMEFLTKVQIKLYQDRNVSNTLKMNRKKVCIFNYFDYTEETFSCQ